MHAKHADDFGVVRRAVGYAFDFDSCTLTPNALNTVNAKLIACADSSFRLRIGSDLHSDYRHLRVLRASSASSALRFFLLRGAAGFASGIADRRDCRYAEPLPGAAQSVGSSCWGTGPLDWCHGIGVGGGPADASRRTQPRYDVRYHTGLIFLYMLREPVKLSPPMRPQARIGTANNANDPSGLGATGTTHRPCGAVYFALFAFFAVPTLAARGQGTEGRNGASRGGLSSAEARAEARPGEGRAQVAADVVLAKSRNNPPAGAGVLSPGSTRAGAPPGGRTGTGLGGRGFCEIAQRPSRRGRLFPPGSARAGARPGERQAQVAADLDLRNCATTLPPGSVRAGARPGEGRVQVAADVVFAKLRNDPPAGAGSSRRVRRGRGHVPGKDRHNRATTLPPGAGSSRRARRGRRHDPGKDGHRSRRTWFLRNCATTLPPGSALPAGVGAGGGTTRGRTGTGRSGRGFAKLRNNPPAGFDPRRGTTRGRTGTGRGGCGFAKLRNDPLAGFDPGGGATRGRTGTGRGGRGFCEIAQRPSRRGRLLPPGSALAGFCEMRNDPWVRCERVCPWVRCPEGVRDATVRQRLGGGYDRVGSLGPRTLTRVAARPGLGPLFAAQARRRER